MMGILADRFFSWFRTNRSIVVLVYGLATAALSVNAGFTLAYVGDLLTNQPPYIGPHILHISSTPSTNSILNLGYVISSIVSFLMTWIATALLLHHYSKKIGRPVYWTIVSIPLVYFLGQFQPLILGIFSEYRLSESSYIWCNLHASFLSEQTSGWYIIWNCILDYCQKNGSEPSKGLPNYFCIWNSVIVYL